MTTAHDLALDRITDWADAVEILTPPDEERPLKAATDTLHIFHLPNQAERAESPLAAAASRPTQVTGPTLDELDEAADVMAALVAKYVGRVAGHAARRLGGVVTASADAPPLLEFHLPGKHDQSTHGHGAGGVRRELADAKSIGELNAVAGAEAKRITGRDIPFDMAGSDLQIAREHTEGVLQGLERFPATRLESVGVGHLADGHYAEAHRGRIVFNSTHASSAGQKQYREKLAKDVEGWHKGLQVYGISDMKIGGFHVRNGGSPRAVALHEFGHILDISTTAHRGGPEIDLLVTRSTRQERRRPKLPGTPIRDSGDFIHRSVSAYAMTNRHELVAEAFTDVMINGAGASKLSQGIVDIVESHYR